MTFPGRLLFSDSADTLEPAVEALSYHGLFYLSHVNPEKSMRRENASFPADANPAQQLPRKPEALDGVHEGKESGLYHSMTAL